MRRLAPLRARLALLAGALALLLAAVEVVADWTTRLELNVSIIYALPLVLAGLSRSRRLLWSLALLLACMTFAVYAAQIAERGGFSLGEPFFRNRVLSAVATLVTAGLLHLWTRALDALEDRDRILKEQNARLDALNGELLRYQEQITHQNRELDVRRRQVEEVSARKSVLLASMSHDIRTPLNAINLTAAAIGRTVENPALAGRIPALAERLRANTLSVSNLVSDVLDLSTFELGRVELHPTEFCLDELVREEVERLRPLAQAKHLTLESEPSPAPIRIRADRVKLERVVSNLVVNAIKYTETGEVGAAVGGGADGGVWIRIRDTGVGIAPEDLEGIFDEFARIADERRDRAPGSGLGLAICRQLIGLMGGSISVESTCGAGSLFTVALPPSCVVMSLPAALGNG